MVSVPCNTAPLPLATHFARMCLANKYKTAFPVRRVPFGVVDKFCPEILRTGLKLVSSVIGRPLNNVIYSEADISELYEARAMDPEPLEFDSKFVEEVEHVATAVAAQFQFPEIETLPDANSNSTADVGDEEGGDEGQDGDDEGDDLAGANYEEAQY